MLQVTFRGLLPRESLLALAREACEAALAQASSSAATSDCVVTIEQATARRARCRACVMLQKEGGVRLEASCEASTPEEALHCLGVLAASGSLREALPSSAPADATTRPEPSPQLAACKRERWTRLPALDLRG